MTNGYLVGYEIKSDRDTIGRLPDQMAVYGQIFEYTSVISGPKHIEKLKEFLPHYCGILLSEPYDKGIKLTTIIEPSNSTDLSAFYIASLLWHDEACSLLKSIGLGKGARKKE